MSEADEKKFVDELKQLIQRSKDQKIHKFIEKEEYLLQFIRGRKYKVEYAFETLKYDYKIRHEKYPYIFENFRPSSLSHVYEAGILGILKNRDEEGRVIMFYRAGRWNTENVSALEVELASQLFIKEIGLLLDTQMNGVSVIFDNEGFTSEHAKYNGIMDIKRFFDLCLSYPCRYGMVFLMNVPMMLEMTYNLAKIFLKTKLREKIFVSRSGYKDLHSNISPDILPKCFGGRLTEEEATDSDIFQRILDKEDFYANYNKIY